MGSNARDESVHTAAYENLVANVQNGTVYFDSRDLAEPWTTDHEGEMSAPFDVQLGIDERESSDLARFLSGLRPQQMPTDQVYAVLMNYFRWGFEHPQPFWCALCGVDRVNTLFFPCHHILLCARCARIYRLCPGCGCHFAVFDPDFSDSVAGEISSQGSWPK